MPFLYQTPYTRCAKIVREKLEQKVFYSSRSCLLDLHRAPQIGRIRVRYWRKTSLPQSYPLHPFGMHTGLAGHFPRLQGSKRDGLDHSDLHSGNFPWKWRWKLERRAVGSFRGDRRTVCVDPWTGHMTLESKGLLGRETQLQSDTSDRADQCCSVLPNRCGAAEKAVCLLCSLAGQPVPVLGLVQTRLVVRLARTGYWRRRCSRSLDRPAAPSGKSGRQCGV